MKKKLLKINKNNYLQSLRSIIDFIKKVSVKSKANKISNILEKFKKSKKYIYLLEKFKKLNIDRNSSRKSFLFNHFYKQLKKIKFIDNYSKLNSTNEKFNQKIGILFYADHKLLMLSVNISIDNKMFINGVTEIPIPTTVIGDSLVEDVNELANITLDGINLLEIDDCPLLVILSSSFFTLSSFPISDLKQISETDKKIQSKSPYLPSNSIIEFKRSPSDKNSEEYVQAIYSSKELIKSWTDTLEIIDFPIIGLIPQSPCIFDVISKQFEDENYVLIDIETNVTSVLIGNKLSDLSSHKLPFGSSLYVSSNLKETSKNYFDRVLNSIKIIFDESSKKLPNNIYVIGRGLDHLMDKKSFLPKGFKRVSQLNLSNYSYIPEKILVNELVSESIFSSIDSISIIVKSCL